jgi:hypothetical protein
MLELAVAVVLVGVGLLKEKERIIHQRRIE